MEQRNVTGHAYRVLTDGAADKWDRISLWTHSDDVEMKNGDNLTTAFNNKYNLDTDSGLIIRSLDDVEMNTSGVFNIDLDVGSITTGAVTLYAGYPYTYFSYQASNNQSYKTILVVNFSTEKMLYTPLYVLRRTTSGWNGYEMLSNVEGDDLRKHTDTQIGLLDRRKYGIDKLRKDIMSLDDIPMNTACSVRVTPSSGIGYYDKKANITTALMPGEYVCFSYQNESWHKFIVMFSNTQQESELMMGGGYVCTNAGSAGSSWVITRILSPIDFSSDESGLREQIVASLTGQLWPVGAIYINMTKENPGNFLGGTWNLITEGILTAINGSPEKTGYHQRDLYKAVQDEDRGEHLYGVFAWQRIA